MNNPHIYRVAGMMLCANLVAAYLFETRFAAPQGEGELVARFENHGEEERSSVSNHGAPMRSECWGCLKFKSGCSVGKATPSAVAR